MEVLLLALYTLPDFSVYIWFDLGFIK